VGPARRQHVYTAAAVWRQRVYIGTYDGQFMAFNAATGPAVALQASSAIHGAPSVIDGLVYFAACPAVAATPPGRPGAATAAPTP
jgi:outer membrane protein assembly factor BamB